MPIPVTTTVAAVRTVVADARQASRTVALVPTLGALHDGHAALIRAARTKADYVVVSVFVNPTQFGPTEDFARYPRTLDADRQLAAGAGANFIFAPTVDEMYPPGSVAFVEVPHLDAVLCGASRPGHFRGVCTVVLKLFNIVTPDVAVFGAKDYQQSRIIQRMVRDLNVPVRVDVEPTVREADGLAMSSRNRYLSADERAVAPRIHEALHAVRDRAVGGESDVSALEVALHRELAAIPGARVDYARILDADDLSPLARLDRPAVAAVAVVLGRTRLIDNVTLP